MELNSLITGLLFMCWVFCCSPIGCTQTKYSAHANLDITELMNEVKPFRIKKVNMLWTNARKRGNLTKESRIDLFKDLQNLDKLEIRFKKMRSDGLDQNGLMEEKVLYHFKRIVETYSLEDSNGGPGQENRKAALKVEYADKSSNYFEDSKLQEMWKHSEMAGFSEEDLNLLWQEFSHQQMKINEFNLAHGELHDLHEMETNDINEDHDKDKLNAKRRDKLAIHEGFARLDNLAATLTPITGSFEDGRLNSLWAMAQKSKWSEEKLTSFKEELRHFEKRINKQKYYAEQLQLSKQSFENHQAPEKHKLFQEKTKMLDREVKKYHAGLKERVAKAIKHTEL